LEKTTIKSIKYKVEIIKSNGGQEEWGAIDKVCKALALGEKEQLRYQKYRRLDLSNLKQIEVKSMGMAELRNG
jgi:hypothetical protein